MSTIQRNELDDSEDDDDYVPPIQDALESDSSSDSEPDNKRARGEINKEEKEEPVDEEERKRQQEALWAAFTDTTGEGSTTTERLPPVKMVKIEKRYLFAGESVVKIEEVPENSPDAKKWPLYDPERRAETPSTTGTTTPGNALPEEPTASTSTQNSTPSTPLKPKRPGPRKPRTSLAPVPSQKAKKLSTLEKSAMDWQAHVQAQEAAGVKEELEANRRGGGYLEKVEFLQRVDGRKDELLEASKGRKRRRP